MSPRKNAEEPESMVKKRDGVARVATEVLDAGLGAAAGAAFGILGGPLGSAAGAAIGATAGALLGHELERERGERAARHQALDAIDVEQQFFGQPRALGVGDPPLPALALPTLAEEHSLTLTVLTALEAWAGHVFEREIDDKPGLRQFVTFFRDLMDGMHRYKEDEILTEALIDGGLPPGDPAIVKMSEDHARGSELLATLDELSSAGGPWSFEQRREVDRAVSLFVAHQRGHVERAEDGICALARTRLSPARAEELTRKLEAYDASVRQQREAWIGLGWQLVAAAKRQAE